MWRIHNSPQGLFEAQREEGLLSFKSLSRRRGVPSGAASLRMIVKFRSLGIVRWEIYWVVAKMAL